MELYASRTKRIILMNPNLGGLQDKYELSQSEIGEKLFLKQQTIQKIEQTLSKYRCSNGNQAWPNVEIRDITLVCSKRWWFIGLFKPT